MRASDLLPLGQLEAPWSSWRANSVEALLVRLRSAPRVLWCLPVLETSQGAFLGSGRGPAGVVNLADSVEFPYWNETELRQIRHVTSLLPRLPRSGSIAVTRHPPIEAYTYSTSHAHTWQGVRITSASHLQRRWSSSAIVQAGSGRSSRVAAQRCLRGTCRRRNAHGGCDSGRAGRQARPPQNAVRQARWPSDGDGEVAQLVACHEFIPC